MIREESLQLTFRYAAGSAASAFLTALRDERRLLAARCGSCQRVSCPPPAHCARCGEASEELVEVGPGGEVLLWTEQGGRALGLVRLDGAETPLVHRLLGEGWRGGERVWPRFAEERTGSVLDIEGFAREEP